MSEKPKKPRLSPTAELLLAILLVLVLWCVDWLSGANISFSIFYLIPVGLTSLHVGFRAGLAVALLSGAGWHLAEFLADPVRIVALPLWVPIWNTIMRVMIFTLVATILVKLKATIKEAEEARAMAQAATEAKSEFLANMSHEIRTPMNALLGVADLLAETPLTREQKEYVEIFRSQGEHLRRLINDILDLSKIEAGQLELERKPFELAELVRALVDTFTPRARQKGLALRAQVDPAANGGWWGDQFRLRQSLANLLGNALKFTQEGEVRLEVTVEPSKAETKTILFRVSDTGAGIPAEMHDKIFKRFGQAHSSAAAFGGTGLGLSITKTLIEKMGGTIGFESTAGVGSTFYFSLPMEPAELPREDHVIHLAQEAGPAHKGRVLLVEDDRINQMVFTQFLKDFQCTVEIRGDGRTGLEQFKSADYDLVLLDMQMPEMDGWTAARHMRAWERDKGRATTPIVALTASALKEEMERCYEAGCTAFLAKPVRKKEFLEIIQKSLQTQLRKNGDKKQRIDPELRELLPAFMEDMRQRVQKLRELVQKEDYEQVRRLGHQLAGAGGTYGFQEISVIGRGLEEAGNGKNPADIARLIDALEAELREIA